MKVPKQYSPIMPYINVMGAADFTTFMQQVFKAEIQYVSKAGDKVQHAELRIGDAVIMYMDANTIYPPFPNASFLWVDNVDEVFARAVALGCPILNEIADRDYGRGGGFSDPFGNIWWVNSAVE